MEVPLLYPQNTLYYNTIQQHGFWSPLTSGRSERLVAIAAEMTFTMRALQRHAAIKLGVDLLAMRTVQIQCAVASLLSIFVGLEFDAVFLKEKQSTFRFGPQKTILNTLVLVKLEPTELPNVLKLAFAILCYQNL